MCKVHQLCVCCERAREIHNTVSIRIRLEFWKLVQLGDSFNKAETIKYSLGYKPAFKNMIQLPSKVAPIELTVQNCSNVKQCKK